MISEKAKEIIHKIDTEREYNDKKEQEKYNEIKVIKDYGICPRCGERINQTKMNLILQTLGYTLFMGEISNDIYICKRCKLKFKF